MSTQEFFLPQPEPPPEAALDSFSCQLADITTLILASEFSLAVFGYFSRIIELQINTLMAMYSHQDMITSPEWEDMSHGEFRQLLEEVEKTRDSFGTNLAIVVSDRDKKMLDDEEFATLYVSIEKGFDNLVKTQGIKPSIPKALHKKSEILQQIKTSLSLGGFLQEKK